MQVQVNLRARDLKRREVRLQTRRSPASALNSRVHELHVVSARTARLSSGYLHVAGQYRGQELSEQSRCEAHAAPPQRRRSM